MLVSRVVRPMAGQDKAYGSVVFQQCESSITRNSVIKGRPTSIAHQLNKLVVKSVCASLGRLTNTFSPLLGVHY